MASAGQQIVDVDFEAPTLQRAEELRQSGVQLPRVSSRAADPQAHRDFVDRRVTAVGFGITAGGYLLYCDGMPLPVLVPESHVDLGVTSAEPLSASIYPDRDSALADVAASTSASVHARYAYYRAAGGALIVPTFFSPATTPRIARTMLEVRKHLSETTQRELKVLLLTMTGAQRPVGSSPTQNARVQADIEYLQAMGATNIRVNQQQLTYRSGQRVGVNRPDLQFDYGGRRYHVEYETPTSGRGPGHQRRITSNDPNAEIILLIVP